MIFAIKIPNEFVTVQLRVVLPIHNVQNKEIDYPKEIVFQLNDTIYKYEESKYLKELESSKQCIYHQNCNQVRINNENR